MNWLIKPVLLLLLPVILIPACGPNDDDVWTDEREVVATIRSKYISYDVVGNVQNYTSYEHDDQGRPTLTTNYSDAGANTIWFDGDDTIADRRGFTYNADGNLDYVWFSTNPGADGVWGNADDSISFWYEFRYGLSTGPVSEISRVIYHNTTPGPDGDWFTTDDPVSSYTDVYFDTAFPNQKYSVSYTDPGDAIWFNGNDIIDRYRKEWLQNGLVVQSVQYTGSGANATWLDEDDLGSTVNQFIYDTGGNLVRSNSYNSGIDNIPLNIDDSFTGYADYYPGIPDYYALLSINKVFPMLIAVYTGNGNNGQWYDVDDETSSYNVLAEDQLNNRFYMFNYLTGPDNRAYTADDSHSGSYSIGVEDDAGFLVEYMSYTDVGLDGVTPNDRLSFKFILSPVYEKQAVDPLVDGIF